MIDGLNELGRSNRTTPEAVESLVAIDRQALMTMLDADSDEGRRSHVTRSHVTVGQFSRSTTRVGYVGAMVAAAAAVFVGISMIGGGDPPTDLDQVESAETTTALSTPLVVEGVDQVPSTTAAAPTTTPVDASDSSGSDGSGVTPDRGPASRTQIQPTTTDTQGLLSPSPRTDGPFDQSVDLLALHYDHAHLDDGHAAAAAREMATWFGLEPHVVAGTQPAGSAGYVHDFEPVMQAVWGDSWLNAQLDWSGAVSRSAERWLAAIDAGGRVWVAEGGVADFTAEVVREVQKRRPGLDTRTAIRVVQHSDRNESESAPENLSFVKASTTYERIDDGNSANGTADLNQQSGAFKAAALAGPHRTSWSAAFEYLPAAELDFSDTVEVLHILGVGTDEVADPDDFASRFMR